jgi:hypothetical protein
MRETGAGGPAMASVVRHYRRRETHALLRQMLQVAASGGLLEATESGEDLPHAEETVPGLWPGTVAWTTWSRVLISHRAVPRSPSNVKQASSAGVADTCEAVLLRSALRHLGVLGRRCHLSSAKTRSSGSSSLVLLAFDSPDSIEGVPLWMFS